MAPAPAPVFAAVDIGASSGRVVAGTLRDDRVELDVVHRFPNGAALRDGHLRWDISGLFAQVLVGLGVLAGRHPGVVSVGVDTWAVDYGLLDAAGRLVAEPVAYRDDRTSGVIEQVHERIGPRDLYASTGLQFLPFNTLYQLEAERRGPSWPAVERVVLLPDLLAYWLSGVLRTELTNASTTGLLDARSRTWSATVLDALDLPAELFAPLVEPGAGIGTISADVAARTGLAPDVRVVAVGSHDTASAVVGVPARTRRFGYVSSGTWSLVGVELDEPVLSEESRLANFTNEGGVDGRVRYLRNVGGLWLLQESVRTWRGSGPVEDQAELLAGAAALPDGGPVIDVDATELIAPGDLPARIRAACVRTGQPPPETRAQVVRCILDSLATAYATTLAQAEQLSGQRVDVVHVVGGGSQNALLCQLTADLSGRPVLAGPVEATALGNVAVQARAAGLLPAGLDDLRGRLAAGSRPTAYVPSPTRAKEPVTP